MSVIKNLKVQKTFVWTLKLVLFIAVLFFFVQQILRIEFNQFNSIQLEHPMYIVLVLLLLPVNWGLELVKWQRILKVNNIHYNLKELSHSLFSGVTTGIITPNRIGNFIGRMLFFKGKLRGQLILGTLYSNFSQFLVTLFFGVLSIIFLMDMILDAYTFSLVNISILIFFVALLFYISVPFLPLHRIKFLNRKLNILIHFQKQSKKLFLPLLTFSGLRYIVFSMQFLLMLMSFGVKPSILLYAGILMLYLVSTLTPSIFFGKLVIRETAGLIILSLFVENPALIIVSSLLLWFINLGVPSLLGLFFILKRKTLANA